MLENWIQAIRAGIGKELFADFNDHSSYQRQPFISGVFGRCASHGKFPQYRNDDIIENSLKNSKPNSFMYSFNMPFFQFLKINLFKIAFQLWFMLLIEHANGMLTFSEQLRWERERIQTGRAAQTDGIAIQQATDDTTSLSGRYRWQREPGFAQLHQSAVECGGRS